jgi:hypothetical protein
MALGDHGEHALLVTQGQQKEKHRMGWPPRLYASTRWRKRSLLHRKRFPLCAACGREGRVQEAHLAHHLREHQPGDPETEFWFGALESSCFSHHLRAHGRPPPLGYRRDIGPDGYPLDPGNPFWVASDRQERQDKWRTSDSAKSKAKL